MFTIKLYRNNAFRQRIYEAESFTVLRCNQGSSNGSCTDWVEVTAHVKSGDDLRFDVGPSPYLPSGGVWERAIIENATGRTTEIIGQNAPAVSEQTVAQAA